MINSQKREIFPELPEYVGLEAKGMQLCSYLIALEAWRRGLKIRFFSPSVKISGLAIGDKIRHGRIFSIENNEKKHYFCRSRGDLVSNNARKVCKNKGEAKIKFREASVPHPEGFSFNIQKMSMEEILIKAKKIGYPVVLKPQSGSMGKGVLVNISSKEELSKKIEELIVSANNHSFIIEKHLTGNEYRCYVVGDKVIGIINRIPANVIGDGEKTIKELIEEKNNERKKIPFLTSKLIKVDKTVKENIKKLGYNLNTVPKQNQVVYLRDVSNLAMGGDPIDVTDSIPEEVKQVAVSALKAVDDLPHAGVDIIVDEKDHKKAYVLEINSTAEIGFHQYPLSGKPRNVAKAIVDYYFPETESNVKSSLFFDFQKMIGPLKNGSASEIVMHNIPQVKNMTFQYLLKGDFTKKSTLTLLQNQAFKCDINGYLERISNNEVKVVASGFNEKDINKLENFMNNGKKLKSEIVNKTPSSELVKFGFLKKI